jgi:hypothetical protein
MRVMLLHKVNAETEAGIIPPASLIAAVGAMVGAMKEANILRDGAGLRPSALGVRLTFARGQRSEQPGPFLGRNEDPAAFCVVRTRTRDEAVEIATRFAAVLGDGECDIRPVTEPWDLGFGEKPKDDPTTRWMLVWKADPSTAPRQGESVLPSLQTRAALGKLITDLVKAGVLLQGEAFKPSREAKRIPMSPGKRRAIDGPFAESKELISGFCTIEVPTLADALPWAERYIAAVPGVELDVRPLYEADELTS